MGTTNSSLGHDPPSPPYQRGSFVRVMNNQFAPPGARNCDIGVVVGGQGMRHHIVLFVDQTCRVIETSTLKMVHRVSRRHRALLAEIVDREMRARLRDKLRHSANFGDRCAFPVGTIVTLKHANRTLISKITNTWAEVHSHSPTLTDPSAFVGVVSLAAVSQNNNAVLVTFGAPVLDTVIVNADYLCTSPAKPFIKCRKQDKALHRLVCMVSEECCRERARAKDSTSGDKVAPIVSRKDHSRLSTLEEAYRGWCVRGIEQMSAKKCDATQKEQISTAAAVEDASTQMETIMRIDSLIQHIDNLERLLIAADTRYAGSQKAKKKLMCNEKAKRSYE